MARIKVHELAKEIGISNKEVQNYLNEKGYGVRTAVSVVPENEVENIRKRYGKSSPKSPEGKTEPAKEVQSSGSTEKKTDGDGKKKSGIVRVLRTQNATKKIQRRPKARTGAGEEKKTDVLKKAEAPEKTEPKQNAAVKEEKIQETHQEKAAPQKPEALNQQPDSAGKKPEPEKKAAPDKTEQKEIGRAHV